MATEAVEKPSINAILAGLRLLQMHSDRLPDDIENVATDDGEIEIMGNDAIDELCEMINIEGLSFGEQA